MTTYLGSRNSPAPFISNDNTNPWGNGFWVVKFDPAVFAVSSNAFEIYHMTLTGPSGSQLQVFTDTTFYDITNRGDINSWDANHALFLYGGQTLFFYWNSAGTPPPKVTVWMRSPALT